MVHDEGFDLPDIRHTFLTEDGEVTVRIVRHWYMNDDEYEPDFKVSWDIHYDRFERGGTEITNLPIGTYEEQAVEIAHVLYKEDEEATKDNNETNAMYEAERRMGA